MLYIPHHHCTTLSKTTTEIRPEKKKERKKEKKETNYSTIEETEETVTDLLLLWNSWRHLLSRRHHICKNIVSFKEFLIYQRTN
jgi:hypothetical protein